MDQINHLKDLQGNLKGQSAIGTSGLENSPKFEFSASFEGLPVNSINISKYVDPTYI